MEACRRSVFKGTQPVVESALLFRRSDSEPEPEATVHSAVLLSRGFRLLRQRGGYFQVTLSSQYSFYGRMFRTHNVLA